MPKYLPDVDLFTNILNNGNSAAYFNYKTVQNEPLRLTKRFRIFTISKFTVTDLGNKVLCQGPPEVNILALYIKTDR